MANTIHSKNHKMLGEDEAYNLRDGVGLRKICLVFLKYVFNIFKQSQGVRVIISDQNNCFECPC